MPSTEFETVSSDDKGIVVQHIPSGLFFTFKVGTNPSGERLLQTVSMHGGERPIEDPNQAQLSAQTYAQLEMERAGRVDPKVVTGGRIRR